MALEEMANSVRQGYGDLDFICDEVAKNYLAIFCRDC